MIAAGGLILAALIGLFLLSRKDSYSAGQEKEKLKHMENMLDDVYTAKQARDRLDSDPDYAKRVRDKGTRR